MQKRYHRTVIFRLFIVLLFVQCSSDDEPEGNTCTENMVIDAFRPEMNPAASPVMIVGRNFSPAMTLHFGNVTAPVEYINSEVIVTRIPDDFSGFDSDVELVLRDGNCELQSKYRIIPTFPDYERANPPFIHFPDENRKIILALDQYVGENEFSCAFVRNIWGFNQILCIDKISRVMNNQVEFNGHEEINSFFHRVNSFSGVYDGQTMDMTIEVSYMENLDEEPMEKDILRGAFYEDEILTTSGVQQMKYLFLESDITGRQFMFSIIP